MRQQQHPALVDQHGGERRRLPCGVVGRKTGASQWHHARDVGLVDRATIQGVSKDNVVFGVQALGERGFGSLVSYPPPFTQVLPAPTSAR